ncbi:ribonuclease domain-containing protein [Chitinimonas naiadis]
MRILLLFLLSLPGLAAGLDDCKIVAQKLNQILPVKLDSQRLASTLSQLNRDGRLPDDYLDKRAARAAGWQPGKPLPVGKSIGGDPFRNFEGRLPQGNWREADLDYRGGKRNAKRLIFEPRQAGRRYVTVDHYQQFTEIPACR